MKRKILMLALLLILSNLIIAQKVDYNEVLQNTKNIQSAYKTLRIFNQHI